MSAAKIAERADRFPSQITYYFGSKEALLAEAASRELLHLAATVEEAVREEAHPEDWVRRVVDLLVVSDELLWFARTLILAQDRRELRPLVNQTLDRLHTEGARAAVDTVAARGWRLRGSPEAGSRAFWTAALGAALQAAATGPDFDRTHAEHSLLLVFDLPTAEERSP